MNFARTIWQDRKWLHIWRPVSAAASLMRTNDGSEILLHARDGYECRRCGAWTRSRTRKAHTICSQSPKALEHGYAKTTIHVDNIVAEHSEHA